MNILQLNTVGIGQEFPFASQVYQHKSDNPSLILEEFSFLNATVTELANRKLASTKQ